VKRKDLQAVVAKILEVEPDELRAEVVLESIEAYDSVTVLSLMIRLDEAAGIKLEPSDVQRLRTYGDIEALAARQGITLTD